MGGFSGNVFYEVSLTFLSHYSYPPTLHRTTVLYDSLYLGVFENSAALGCMVCALWLSRKGYPLVSIP